MTVETVCSLVFAPDLPVVEVPGRSPVDRLVDIAHLVQVLDLAGPRITC